MRVVLETAVFAKTPLTDLLPFLWFAWSGRHRIDIEDPDAEEYRRWLDTLSDQRLREDWEEAVRRGQSEGAKEPSFHEVRVTVRERSAWSLPIPSLTVTSAVDLLQRPYRILVENGISDRCFLLSICGSQRERMWIEERIEREWVEVEHCGGIEHLRARAEHMRKDVGRAMRCSALFDSDALQPRRPSKASRKAMEACGSEIHRHQLAWRSIENFLPRAALERWCKQASGEEQKRREGAVKALFALMSLEQRAHYSMKEGFAKDEKRGSEVGNLYDGLSTKLSGRQREMLREGLGSDIATLYQHSVRPEDFEDSEAVRAMRLFVQEIIERIR